MRTILFVSVCAAIGALAMAGGWVQKRDVIDKSSGTVVYLGPTTELDMMYNFFPSVPFSSPLGEDGIKPGQSVVIRGIRTGGDFSFNLMTGPKVVQDNHPLHITIREQSFVFNAFAGGWGIEERKPNTINEGEIFELRIRAHNNYFQILVNDKEVHNFAYRQPLASINHIIINGDLQLHNVRWGGKKYIPMPYQNQIEGGFTTGRRLFVSAILDKGANVFVINFRPNPAEIAFHIVFRFGENAVVRNSYQGGRWISEERDGKFPLERGTAFSINIVYEPQAFQVFINGKHFCSFAHRVNPKSIQTIEIGGEVELQDVRLE